MNTLIELYDERAIENILAPDMFRPQRIVYLCPGEIVRDRTRQEKLAAFFRASLYLFPKEKQLLRHFRRGLRRRSAR